MMKAKHDGTEIFEAGGELVALYVPVPGGVLFLLEYMATLIPGVQLIYDIQSTGNDGGTKRVNVKLIDDEETVEGREARKAENALRAQLGAVAGNAFDVVRQMLPTDEPPPEQAGAVFELVPNSFEPPKGG